MGEYKNSELVKRAMDQIVLKACIEVIPVHLFEEYREDACEYGIYRNISENQRQNIEQDLTDLRVLIKQLDVRAFLNIVRRDQELYKRLAKQPKDAYYIKSYCDELKNTYNRVAHPTENNYLDQEEVERAFDTMKRFLAGFGEQYVTSLKSMTSDNDEIKPVNEKKTPEEADQKIIIGIPVDTNRIFGDQNDKDEAAPDLYYAFQEDESTDLSNEDFSDDYYVENESFNLNDYLEALTEESNKEKQKENIDKYQLTEGVLKFKTAGSGYYSFSNTQSHNFPVTRNIKYPKYYRVFLRENDEKYFEAQIYFCESNVVEILISGLIRDNLPSVFIQSEDSGLSSKLRESLQYSFYYSPICKSLVSNHNNSAASLHKPDFGSECAIKKAITQPISIIWGPPGTGKTEVIAKICRELVLRHERVLVTSTSNIAIDEAILRIGKNYPSMEGSVFRYGFIANKELENSPFDSFRVALKRNISYPSYSKIRNKYVSNQNTAGLGFDDISRRMVVHDDVRYYEKSLINNASIVGTTLAMSLLSPLFKNENSWDAVIVDEVSMASLPYIFCMSALAKKRVVFVGDFRQLAPISKSGRPELTTDIFSFLNIVDNSGRVIANPLMTTLNVQHRMHPEIADCILPLYEDLKTDSEIIESRNIIASSEPFKGHAVSLVDCQGILNYCETSPISKSCYNILSAMLAVRIAKQALPANVSIITPFRAQVGLINALLSDEKLENKILVSTVHRFQGHESDVVIFDSVESFGKDKRLESIFVGGNEEEKFPGRLVTVASTRARGKLIVIADMQYLSQSSSSSEVQEVVRFMRRFESKHHFKRDELVDFVKSTNSSTQFKIFEPNIIPKMIYQERTAEAVGSTDNVVLFGGFSNEDYGLNRSLCYCFSAGKALHEWVSKNSFETDVLHKFHISNLGNDRTYSKEDEKPVNDDITVIAPLVAHRDNVGIKKLKLQKKADIKKGDNTASIFIFKPGDITIRSDRSNMKVSFRGIDEAISYLSISEKSFLNGTQILNELKRRRMIIICKMVIERKKILLKAYLKDFEIKKLLRSMFNYQKSYEGIEAILNECKDAEYFIVDERICLKSYISEQLEKYGIDIDPLKIENVVFDRNNDIYNSAFVSLHGDNKLKTSKKVEAPKPKNNAILIKKRDLINSSDNY